MSKTLTFREIPISECRESEKYLCEWPGGYLGWKEFTEDHPSGRPGFVDDQGYSYTMPLHIYVREEENE